MCSAHSILFLYSINQYHLVEIKYIFNIAASSLKCYTGYEGNFPNIPEKNFKERTCSPSADVCFKEYAKIKDGHFGTIKGCYSSIAALALRMKPDECVVGFEENCRRQIGLRSQKTNITDLISRTAGRDFLAQYCNNVGTGMANQGYEMSKCLCTGNLCNSASMLSFCIFPILIIFFIFSVM